MKTVFATVLLLIISLSANAAPMMQVATCSAPLLEGEFLVYISSDRQSATVSYSGVSKYKVTKFYLGPVSSYDFVTSMGPTRILIAVDGGHELHQMNKSTGTYSKISDLNCQINR